MAAVAPLCAHPVRPGDSFSNSKERNLVAKAQVQASAPGLSQATPVPLASYSQSQWGHDHGSCAEEVGIMRGLILSGSNVQSEVVSSCVMSFPVTGKKLLPQNLPHPDFQR